jgi:hypothetical protein
MWIAEGNATLKTDFVVLGNEWVAERTRITLAAELQNATDQFRLPMDKNAIGIRSAQTQFLR